MTDFSGKVAVVTGAGSGIGQALGRRTCPRRRRAGHQRRRRRSPCRHRVTRRRHSERSAGRIGSTSPSVEAVLDVRRRRQRALRQGQPDLQHRGHRVHGRHRDHCVQGPRAGDGRRLLGRRQRHQGIPAAPDRLRRRARREHVQHVRLVRGAGAGRVQRGEVRGARVHRSAASGNGGGRPSREGDVRCTPATSRRR